MRTKHNKIHPITKQNNKKTKLKIVEGTYEEALNMFSHKPDYSIYEVSSYVKMCKGYKGKKSNFIIELSDLISISGLDRKEPPIITIFKQ